MAVKDLRKYEGFSKKDFEAIDYKNCLELFPLLNIRKESKMEEKKQFGKITQILACICHSCKICTYADRKPDSAFGKTMRWHRKWCPAWAAHIKVYGEKPLSR